MLQELKVKYQHWLFKLPFMSSYAGITLFGVIYVCYDQKHTPLSLLVHEAVHVRQQTELGCARFYARYLWEYFCNLIKYRDHWLAYYNISFEREAYQTQADFVKGRTVANGSTRTIKH